MANRLPVIRYQAGRTTVVDNSNVSITGELKLWCAEKLPIGWLLCDGSAVDRTTYRHLFNTIGTRYGNGDGTTTFNIPDLRGRVPIGTGQGPGLSERRIGDVGGEESHRQTENEMAKHSHRIMTGAEGRGAPVTSEAKEAFLGDHTDAYRSEGSGEIFLNKEVVEFVGQNEGANVMQPYTCLNFIIKT